MGMCPVTHSREMSCLLRAHIGDISERLPSLRRSAEYFPLLLFQVGTSDMSSSSLRSIPRDDRALGAVVRDSGGQVSFPSILLVKGRGLKGPIQSGKSTNGYRTSDTSHVFAI